MPQGVIVQGPNGGVIIALVGGGVIVTFALGLWAYFA